MSELVAGQLHAVSDHVHRLVAPNPGPMTGAGTNTYVVGRGELALIDPGPDLPAHQEAMLAAVHQLGRLALILVTHTHPDHSPAARHLAAQTGAKVLGPFQVDDMFQDTGYAPDELIHHDQLISVGGASIRAIHTPGHVGNHFCFLVEEDGLLLTGDHIMNGSTVVIIPPGGDMQDYIASLRLLRDYPLRNLGPGHGGIISDPYQEIERIIDHRMMREAKVLTVIRRELSASLEELTPLVYDDVDTALHPIAQLSLHAHLIKLEKERIVCLQQTRWLYLAE